MLELYIWCSHITYKMLYIMNVCMSICTHIYIHIYRSGKLRSIARSRASNCVKVWCLLRIRDWFPRCEFVGVCCCGEVWKKVEILKSHPHPRTHVHTHTHTHKHTNTQKHTHTHTHIHTHIHSQTRTHTHTHTYTSIFAVAAKHDRKKTSSPSLLSLKVDS